MQNSENIQSQKSTKNPLHLQRILNDRITYSLNIRILFVIILVLIIFRVILFFALPPYYIQIQGVPDCKIQQFKSGTYCHEITFDTDMIWNVNLGGFEHKNQFLVISGEPLKNLSGEVQGYVRYKAEIYQIKKNSDNTFDDKNLGEKLLDWQDEKIFIKCYQQSCTITDFAFLTDLNNEAYKLKIEFQKDDFLDKLKGYKFVVYKGNPKNYDILLGFRYSFMILSLITAILFLYHYLKIDKDNRTFEHTMIVILGFSVILFNDPLIANTLVNPTQASIVISTLFICQFITFLVYFFVMVAIRMKNREFRALTNLNKLWVKGIVFLYFILISIPSCIYQVNVDLHPSYYNDKPYGISLQIFVILAMIITVVVFISTMVVVCTLGGNKQIPQRYMNLSQDCFVFLAYQLIIFATGFYHYASENIGRNISYFLTINVGIWYFQVKFFTYKDFIKIKIINDKIVKDERVNQPEENQDVRQQQTFDPFIDEEKNKNLRAWSEDIKNDKNLKSDNSQDSFKKSLEITNNKVFQEDQDKEIKINQQDNFEDNQTKEKPKENIYKLEDELTSEQESDLEQQENDYKVLTSPENNENNKLEK